MAIKVNDFFSGAKFGAGSKGSSGGIVTWSFGAAFDDPFFKEQVTYAFDIWESVANIDFQLVTDSPASDIRIDWAASGSSGSANYLQSTTIKLRSTAFDTVTRSSVGFDLGVDWLGNPDDLPAGTVSLAAFMLDALTKAMGVDASPDAAGLLQSDNEIPSAGDITVMQALYGAALVSRVPTNGADRILATIGNDVVNALGGNDLIKTYGGNDIGNGGAGKDRIDGGTGDDTLNGGGGADNLAGGIGNDALNGDAGADLINGSFGQDTLHGGSGDDRLLGGYGNDVIFGDDGNDDLAGNANSDIIDGGLGDDRISGGTGNDNLTGGAGGDTFVFANGDDEDWVLDFENGLDKIDLQSFNLANYAQLLTRIHHFEGDTIFTFDGSKLKIIGLSLGEMDATDFIL